jgi:hypothetical protein
MGVITQLAEQIERMSFKPKLSASQVGKLQALSAAAASALRRFQEEEDARNAAKVAVNE